MAHLAAFMQRDEGFGHVVGIHQRIRPVDQQQIEVVGMQMAQRLFRALYDMVAVGDVMADRIAGLGGGGDAARSPAPATGAAPASGAARRRTPVRRRNPVDIRVVGGGDAQFNMLFDERQQLLRRHAPFHQPPVTANHAGKFRPCGARRIRSTIAKTS